MKNKDWSGKKKEIFSCTIGKKITSCNIKHNQSEFSNKNSAK